MINDRLMVLLTKILREIMSSISLGTLSVRYLCVEMAAGNLKCEFKVKKE